MEARRRCRGDPQWLPLGMREGKVTWPQDHRADRLELEVEALKASVGRMNAGQAPRSSCSKDVSPPPAPMMEEPLHAGERVGLQGHDFRDFSCSRERRVGTELQHAGDCHRDGVCPDGMGGYGMHFDKSAPGVDGGEAGYGRWRDGGGAGRWRWWEQQGRTGHIGRRCFAAAIGRLVGGLWTRASRLTLREAQCFYERWKTSSPWERVQITPRLPDELVDTCYPRTEQRGVNLLLKAIPLDQQQALITDRELTSTALLYRLLVRYQPGGAGLTSLDKSAGVPEPDLA